MPEWTAEILGERHALEVLCSNFDRPPCIISFDESQGRHFLALGSFADATDSHAVRLGAQTEITALAGILALDGRESREPLRVGAVHCVDETGDRSVYVTASSGMRITATGNAVLLDEAGTEVETAPEQRRLVKLRRLIAEDANLAKVSRLMQQQDAKTWVGLYRIFEVLCHDVCGDRGLTDWVSLRSISRFKRSSNHPAAAGDAARHGHSAEEPPPAPMSLSEAHAWLLGLVHSWVEHRLS